MSCFRRSDTSCDEWLNSCDAFIDWAYNNGYADDLEIDRIDGSGNYEPSNCRWLTHKENNENRTFGHTKNVAEAEIKKLEKTFDFMGEEWLAEMRGYIKRNHGVDE